MKSITSYLLNYFFPLVLIMASLLAFADEDEISNKKAIGNKVIQCLGREEETLHLAKISDYYYRLNQKLLGKLIGISRIPIKVVYQEKICNDGMILGQKLPPSKALMFLVVLKNIEVFEYKKLMKDGKLDEATSKRNKALLLIFIKEVKEIFLEYLSFVQLNFENVNCFKEKYPEVDNFFNFVKSTLNEENVNSNIWTEEKISRVLQIIGNERFLNQVCKKKK